MSQSTTIKTAALNAFRQAYDKYPVNVSEGSACTGDHRVRVLDGYDSAHPCGRTSGLGGVTFSDVFYKKAMEQAQLALPIVLVTAQDVQNALTRINSQRPRIWSQIPEDFLASNAPRVTQRELWIHINAIYTGILVLT